MSSQIIQYSRTSCLILGVLKLWQTLYSRFGTSNYFPLISSCLLYATFCWNIYLRYLKSLQFGRVEPGSIQRAQRWAWLGFFYGLYWPCVEIINSYQIISSTCLGILMLVFQLYELWLLFSNCNTKIFFGYNSNFDCLIFYSKLRVTFYWLMNQRLYYSKPGL